VRIYWFQAEALASPMEASLPGPQVDPIVEVVLAWAKTQPTIWAIALVGSHARGTARIDSDIDLMLLATDPERFRTDTTWVAQIDCWMDEEYGAAWSRRVWVSDWSVEFTFASLSWAKANPPDAGTRQVVSDGCRILHDPDALLARLCKAIGQDKAGRSTSLLLRTFR
jgi:hypothetical protein